MSTKLQLPYIRFVRQTRSNLVASSAAMSTLSDLVFDLKLAPWRVVSKTITTTLPITSNVETSFFDDSYDTFKASGDVVPLSEQQRVYIGMVAYRFKIPDDAIAETVANVKKITLRLLSDRYNVDGLLASAYMSYDATPSMDWDLLKTGIAATTIDTEGKGVLAQTENYIKAKSKQGDFILDLDEGGGVYPASQQYLYIILQLANWEHLAYPEWVEGAGMFSAKSMIVEFDRDVAPDISTDTSTMILSAGKYPVENDIIQTRELSAATYSANNLESDVSNLSVLNINIAVNEKGLTTTEETPYVQISTLPNRFTTFEVDQETISNPTMFSNFTIDVLQKRVYINIVENQIGAPTRSGTFEIVSGWQRVLIIVNQTEGNTVTYLTLDVTQTSILPHGLLTEDATTRTFIANITSFPNNETVASIISYPAWLLSEPTVGGSVITIVANTNAILSPSRTGNIVVASGNDTQTIVVRQEPGPLPGKIGAIIDDHNEGTVNIKTVDFNATTVKIVVSELPFGCTNVLLENVSNDGWVTLPDETYFNAPYVFPISFEIGIDNNPNTSQRITTFSFIAESDVDNEQTFQLQIVQNPNLATYSLSLKNPSENVISGDAKTIELKYTLPIGNTTSILDAGTFCVLNPLTNQESHSLEMTAENGFSSSGSVMVCMGDNIYGEDRIGTFKIVDSGTDQATSLIGQGHKTVTVSSTGLLRYDFGSDGVFVKEVEFGNTNSGSINEIASDSESHYAYGSFSGIGTLNSQGLVKFDKSNSSIYGLTGAKYIDAKLAGKLENIIGLWSTSHRDEDHIWMLGSSGITNNAAVLTSSMEIAYSDVSSPNAPNATGTDRTRVSGNYNVGRTNYYCFGFVDKKVYKTGSTVTALEFASSTGNILKLINLSTGSPIQPNVTSRVFILSEGTITGKVGGLKLNWAYVSDDRKVVDPATVVGFEAPPSSAVSPNIWTNFTIDVTSNMKWHVFGDFTSINNQAISYSAMWNPDIEQWESTSVVTGSGYVPNFVRFLDDKCYFYFPNGAQEATYSPYSLPISLSIPEVEPILVEETLPNAISTFTSAESIVNVRNMFARIMAGTVLAPVSFINQNSASDQLGLSASFKRVVGDSETYNVSYSALLFNFETPSTFFARSLVLSPLTRNDIKLPLNATMKLTVWFTPTVKTVDSIPAVSSNSSFWKGDVGSVSGTYTHVFMSTKIATTLSLTKIGEHPIDPSVDQFTDITIPINGIVGKSGTIVITAWIVMDNIVSIDANERYGLNPLVVTNGVVENIGKGWKPRAKLIE